MNKVYLSGNLTKDPTVRYTPSGKAYARMAIAVNRPFSKDTTDFFNLLAWEKRAETMGEYLKKGSRILVEGRIQTNSYEKDGVKYNGVEIVVDNFEFAGGKSDAKPDSKPKNDIPDNPPFDPDDTPF